MPCIGTGQAIGFAQRTVSLRRSARHGSCTATGGMLIHVGPRNQQHADEVIGANEIKRICARMAEHTPRARHRAW
jgi:hypothetical protein